jgi:hypothetical protein
MSKTQDRIQREDTKTELRRLQITDYRLQITEWPDSGFPESVESVDKVRSPSRGLQITDYRLQIAEWLDSGFPESVKSVESVDRVRSPNSEFGFGFSPRRPEFGVRTLSADYADCADWVPVHWTTWPLDHWVTVSSSRSQSAGSICALHFALCILNSPVPPRCLCG